MTQQEEVAKALLSVEHSYGPITIVLQVESTGQQIIVEKPTDSVTFDGQAALDLREWLRDNLRATLDGYNNGWTP